MVQAGDNFLIKWACPYCKHRNFNTYPIGRCDACRKDTSGLPLILPKLRTGRRLLTGTRRKRRPISTYIIRQIMEEQDGCCAYCGLCFGQSFEVEHVLALSVGGTNNRDNLVLSCKPCNLTAGPKYFSTFSAKKFYILSSRKLIKAALNK